MSAGTLEQLEKFEVNERGFVSEADRDVFLKALRAKFENRSCFDCFARQNSWVSASFGIFLCMQCASNHRRMGTHISFVRSADLDLFTKEQLRKMLLGGNGRARGFFKTHGLLDGVKTVDYYGKVAAKYRQMLQKEVSAKELEPPAEPAVAPPRLDAESSTDLLGDAPAPPPALVAPPPDAAAAPREAAARPPPGAVHHAVLHHPPGAAAAKLVAKKLDFDFDFENAEFLEPEEPKNAPGGSLHSPGRDGGAPSLDNAGGDDFGISSSAGYAAPAKSPWSAAGGGFSVYTDVQPTASAAPPAAAASSGRFSAAKGISSEDYFAGDRPTSAADKMEAEAKIAKYSSATAISSAGFFGRPEGEPSTLGVNDDASEELSQLAEKAFEGVQRLSEKATSALNKARLWMNQG